MIALRNRVQSAACAVVAPGMNRRLWLLLMIAGSAALSCSVRGPRKKICFPVKGQAFFQGQPAAGVLLVFHPQEDSGPSAWPAGKPRATVAADGTFEIETYGEKDGAPAGDYAVTATWEMVDPRNEEASMPD